MDTPKAYLGDTIFPVFNYFSLGKWTNRRLFPCSLVFHESNGTPKAFEGDTFSPFLSIISVWANTQIDMFFPAF